MAALTLLGSGSLFGTGGTGFGVSESYPAYAVGGETVPPGFLGPVAPTTQLSDRINEGGMPTPGDWNVVGSGGTTPSGILAYVLDSGHMMATVGYGNGVRIYAPGGAGAGTLHVRVTRVSTGNVLYDQLLYEGSLDGASSHLLVDVAFPVFGGYRVEYWSINAVNFDRNEWY